MRKLLLSLSLLVMTAITAMAAVAEPAKSLSALEVVKEYTWTIDYVYGKGYEGFATSVQLDGLYDALGTTAEELDPEINNVTMVRMASEVEGVWTLSDDELVPLEGCSGGNWFGNYEGVGAPMGWNAGDNTIYLQGMSLEMGVYATASTGQFPGLLSVGNENTIDLYICNGTKAAKVTVVINVYEKQTEIEKPVLSYAALEVVKEYNATINFTLGKQYGDIPVNIDIAGAAEALGVSEAELADNIADVLISRTYQDIVAEEGSYISGSELSDAMAVVVDTYDGWFGRYDIYDESTDVTTIYPLNGLKGWGAGCTTYVHNPTVEDGVLTLITGQFPGTFTEAGEQADVIELYIANGAKAVKITCKINIEEPQRIPFEEMTKAGETTVEVTATVDNNYATKPFTIDMAAILEAIGVESVDDFYTWQAEGELGDNHTEGSGGYYYNADGYIQGWGADAAFFIARTSTSLEDGNFTVGQMANAYFADITEPTTVSADMVFLGIDKYYVVKLVYTVKPEEQKGDDFEYTKVGEEGIVMQIVPNNEDQWEWGTKTVLDMDYIESKIGTRDFIIMTDKAKDVKDEDGNVIGKELTYFDASYSCDPKPGFWYGDTTYENKKHQVVVENAGWGSNSFGVCYANGQLTWFQYPGQRQAGDEYMAHLYLVNDETGDYLDYTLVVKYVEEVGEEAETVGTETVEHIVTVSEAEEAELTMELDPAKMYEALGLDAELIEGASVVAPKSSTMYINSSFGESLGYNIEGYYVGVDDEENCAIQAVVEAEDGKLTVLFDVMDIPFAGAEEIAVPVRLGFEYDGKRYMYVITLTNKQPLAAKRLPLIGGSGEGEEMTIEVLEENEDYEPLAATYTITNGTWGNNASHLSIFKYAPLSAELMEGYNGAVVVFDGEVPASEGDPTYGFIPVGFVCPEGWLNIKNTDKFVYTFSDAQKQSGISDFSIFFNASGTLKDVTVTIKGLYLVSDVNATVEEIEAVGIETVAPAVSTAASGIYTISGAKVGALQRGLNIVKMANGEVKKIYVK